MVSALYKLKKKTTPLLMAFLFLGTQVASTAALTVLNSPKAEAATVCTNDTAGANDEPGQKDLTRFCIDSTTGQISWNWDEISVNGANTLDGCALFDTDGDGFVNRAVCISTTDGVTFTKTAYTCNDTRVDRCAGANTGTPAVSTCTLAVTNTDPFTAGSEYPKDLTATCTPVSADSGGGVLVDVCSYPSGQPNSDPSDCIVYRDNSARIEVKKVLNPSTDPGLFNLKIGTTTYATNVGNGGTTGEIVLTSGSITVSETAGTNTNLADYTTTVVCKDANGTGTVVGSGSPIGTTSRQLTFTATDASDIVCVFTNTRQLGTIQVIKNVDTDGDGVIDQTGVTDWNWNIDGAGNFATGSTQNVNIGSHTVSEVQKTGYHVTASSCTGETAPATPNTSLTVTVSNNENVVCTFTNTRDTGYITVNKTLVPASDTGKFNLQVDGSTAGTGANVGDGGTTGQVRVTTGTHAIAETAGIGTNLTNYSTTYICMDGQTQVASGTGTSLASLSVAKDKNIVCTFTNTRYSSLTFVKDAIPNDPQDFLFTTTGGLSPSSFSLDDDSDPTLSNQKVYTNLLPGVYSSTEATVSGWDMTDLVCAGTGVSYTKQGTTASVNLSAGQNITCTYTNTKRAGLSGYKFNDVNGNGVWDAGEPVLADWTIFIDANGNGLLDAGEYSYITAADGLYYFSNLVPKSYTILEQLKNGWAQTLGVGSVTLTAGQSLSNQNFGNQGRGTITVKKDVDTDGDGKVDVFNTSDWTWDLTPNADYGVDPASDVATNTIKNVAAGSYTIHEDQKTNYHFVSVTCSGETVTQAETTTVTVSPGENVVCTYTNARDTGTIEVIKDLVPSTDSGKFDLTINDQVYAEAVGDGGTTEKVTVPTGNYTVGELAGNELTDLTDYFASISGDCNQAGQVSVATGENKVCTITNRKKAKLIVEKVAEPKDAQDFNFSVTKTVENPMDEIDPLDAFSANFALDDDYDPTLSNTHTVANLESGTYVINEQAVDGWVLNKVICSNEAGEMLTPTSVSISLNYGDVITCTFYNLKLGKITIVKDAGPDSTQPFVFSHDIDESGNFTLVDDGTGVLNKKTFTNVYPNQYYGITEHSVDGWRLANYSCDNWDYEEDFAPLRQEIILDGDYENYVYVRPGQDVTCTYKNQQTVLFLTKSNNRPNPTVVGDQVTYTLKVSIPNDAANLNSVVVTDLPPENFKYVAGSWTAHSSVRGDLRALGITTEPTYHSPGQWQLGDMVGGEVVTLTYLATINSVVSPGTYPDVAYASGITDDEELIYDNLTATNTPFVGTLVTVYKTTPPVVVNQLVYTGGRGILAVAVGLFMLISTIGGYMLTRRPALKGGR